MRTQQGAGRRAAAAGSRELNGAEAHADALTCPGRPVLPSPARQALACLPPITALRFWAQTSCHGRTIHFTTSDALLLQYVRSGAVLTGNFRTTNWTAGWYRLQAGHTATYIPQQVDYGWVNQGNQALPYSPFL